MLKQLTILTLLAGTASTSFAAFTPELILRRFDAVPGAPGEFFPLNSFDGVSINNNGEVLFNGIMDTSGIGTAVTGNRRGLWFGTPGNLQLIARDGNPNASGPSPITPGAPGLANPNGWWHNTNTGGAGLTSGSVMTSNGTTFISASLNGTGATTTNNTAFWTGPVGNITMLVQRGTSPAIPTNIAPGTAGATWNTNMNLSNTSNRVNNAGQVIFASELTGGDVVGTTNNNGVFISGPSGTSMLMRRGDQAPGLSAGTLLGLAPTFGIMNNANGRTWFVNHVTGTGAVDANNDVLLTNIDGSLGIIARESESQGLPANTAYTSASTFTNPFSPIGVGATQNNSVWYAASLGGSAVTTANDQALMRYNGGTFSTEWRKGDTTPIAGVNFGNLNTGNSGLSRNEFATLATGLVDAGGGVTSSNDESIWFKQIGQSPVLIAREGNALTSFGELGNLAGLPADATFSNNLVSGSFSSVNVLGQVVFAARYTGTGITSGVNDSGLFLWDAQTGLSVIARTGTVLDPLMGTITQVNWSGTQTGESTMGLSDNGWISFRTRDSVGNVAIYRVQVPAPGATGMLLVGLAMAGRRRRK